jgi:hypothetical protein
LTLLFLLVSFLFDGRVFRVVSSKAFRLPRTEKTFMTAGREGGVFSFKASFAADWSFSSQGNAGGLEGGVPGRVASSEKTSGAGVEGGTVVSELTFAAIVIVSV